MNWFKLYAEFATDPKVQAMSETMQRRLIILYCLRCDGELAKLEDEEIALAMRISPSDLKKTQELFRHKGFIGEGWNLPKWEKRQGPVDPGSAERMRRSRANRAEKCPAVARNVTRNVRVTMPNGDGDVARNVARNNPVTFANPSPPSCSPSCSPPLHSPSYAPPYSPPAPVPPTNLSKERSEPPKGGLLSSFVLPDWIPRQDWDDWIANRKKKPTMRALELAVMKLEKLKGEGNNPGDVLQQSVLGGWTGLFAVRKDFVRKGENAGKTAVQQDPRDTVARLTPPNFDELPDTPENRAVRAMWEGRS